jgi:hypothetical protein
MPVEKIDDAHHVVRHCRARHVERDDTAGICEVFPEAMALRPGETYLSASYYEYFSGSRNERLRAVLTSLKSRYTVKPKDAMVVMNAGKIRKCGDERSLRLRVLHEPAAGKMDYAAIRGIPADEDAQLSAMLCALAVRDITLVSDIN